VAARLGLTSPHQVVVKFLNTEWRGAESAVDVFRNGQQVVRWLEESGFVSIPACNEIDPDELIREARLLRAHIRKLIAQWRTGLVVDVGILNAYLDGGSYCIELSEDQEALLHTVRKYSWETPREVLMGVALAVAQLLAAGDFQFIRKCERRGCDIWFYDRLKNSSRKRCYTARCENCRS
jgi:predicted RNA-binding Zn ribbon-like protein